MNLEEYKFFHQLSEIFKKTSKLGVIRQLLVDQRNLRLRGQSKNYEWELTVKKVDRP